MAYATIDISLREFDDDDLIDEIEDRGYRVVEDDEFVPGDLIPEEVDFILATFSTHAPGTMGYHIYEKMRKR
jgi:hypothetical protein